MADPFRSSQSFWGLALGCCNCLQTHSMPGAHCTHPWTHENCCCCERERRTEARARGSAARAGASLKSAALAVNDTIGVATNDEKMRSGGVRRETRDAETPRRFLPSLLDPPLPLPAGCCYRARKYPARFLSTTRTTRKRIGPAARSLFCN